MSKTGISELVQHESNPISVEKQLPSADARVPLPAEIAHLTLEEQNALERRVVRKMDLRLMPVLIIM